MLKRLLIVICISLLILLVMGCSKINYDAAIYNVNDTVIIDNVAIKVEKVTVFDKIHMYKEDIEGYTIYKILVYIENNTDKKINIKYPICYNENSDLCMKALFDAHNRKWKTIEANSWIDNNMYFYIPNGSKSITVYFKQFDISYQINLK